MFKPYMGLTRERQDTRTLKTNRAHIMRPPRLWPSGKQLLKGPCDAQTYPTQNLTERQPMVPRLKVKEHYLLILKHRLKGRHLI